jgi:hypothetical protein
VPDNAQQIGYWLKRIQEAKTYEEVFAVLDEFRPGKWVDNERALMFKTYTRVLSKLKKPVAQSTQADTKSDGPVWYEKM